MFVIPMNKKDKHRSDTYNYNKISNFIVPLDCFRAKTGHSNCK
jgi:hypothetical protein